MVGGLNMVTKIMLLFLIIISIIAKNKPVTYASIIILILSFFDDMDITRFVKDNFLDAGMTLLMIWMLVPLIDNNNQQSLFNIKNFLNINGLVSFISGLLVVIIAAKGVKYLDNNVSALAGVIIGSIIGVTFFGGVPVGLLTASGISYLIIKFIKSLL